MRLPLLLHISHSLPTLLSPSSSLLYLPLCILLPISPLRLWVLLLPYLLSLSVSFPLSHLLPLAPFAPLSPSLSYIAALLSLVGFVCFVRFVRFVRSFVLACSLALAQLALPPSPSLPHRLSHSLPVSPPLPHSLCLSVPPSPTHSNLWVVLRALVPL